MSDHSVTNKPGINTSPSEIAPLLFDTLKAWCQGGEPLARHVRVMCGSSFQKPPQSLDWNNNAARDTGTSEGKEPLFNLPRKETARLMLTKHIKYPFVCVCVCDFKFYFLKLPYSKIYSLVAGQGEERAYSSMKGNTDIHIPVATIKRIQKSSTIPKVDSTNNSPKLALANNRHNE